ncbi:hypothetical protein [Streptomyces sp. NPDC048623]|uniref:hypothetical protein n=1 Tax=Streptomyces sp. NPDC048623 TaxID=3155761 RepID=UPI00341A6260
MNRAEVLLIGGRAGVGRTTVGWEVSARLRAATIPHCVIEGDISREVVDATDWLSGNGNGNGDGDGNGNGNGTAVRPGD